MSEEEKTVPHKELPAIRLQDGDRTITVQIDTGKKRSGNRWWLCLTALMISVCFNAWLLWQLWFPAAAAWPVRITGTEGSGGDRILVLNLTGTISPPFTETWLRQIEAARTDDRIRAVVLAVDSPGGLVADSHQLYRALQSLKEAKPVAAAFERIAASGGYYVSMGIGTDGIIYAEPTTWTGSVGVIIPRYNMAQLADKIGVQPDPLKTGPLKDTLSPFRDLTDEERVVWDAILDDAFGRFVQVIADNRPNLDETAVRALATGQIYTSDQAVENGLVDRIGYKEDAVAHLAASLNLRDYEVVEYQSTATLLDMLWSRTEPAPTVTSQLLDAAVPRAMYYCTFNPLVGTGN